MNRAPPNTSMLTWCRIEAGSLTCIAALASGISMTRKGLRLRTQELVANYRKCLSSSWLDGIILPYVWPVSGLLGFVCMTSILQLHVCWESGVRPVNPLCGIGGLLARDTSTSADQNHVSRDFDAVRTRKKTSCTDFDPHVLRRTILS